MCRHRGKSHGGFSSSNIMIRSKIKMNWYKGQFRKVVNQSQNDENIDFFHKIWSKIKVKGDLKCQECVPDILCLKLFLNDTEFCFYLEFTEKMGKTASGNLVSDRTLVSVSLFYLLQTWYGYYACITRAGYSKRDVCFPRLEVWKNYPQTSGAVRYFVPPLMAFQYYIKCLCELWPLSLNIPYDL